MWIEVFGLTLSLAIILMSCELFTNGIEWQGRKLGVGDGVVGSIMSAVGTCLPETMIPVIAILFTGGLDSTDIGIGAIVGAPFMLGTLAFFITGLSTLVFWRKRKTGMRLLVNNKILGRDMGFFILVYSIGISVSFVEDSLIRYIVAVFLVACYFYYVILTVRNDSKSHGGKLEPLYLTQYLNLRNSQPVILVQLAIALAGIVFGAEIFVRNIEDISSALGISALVLSLVIAPVATELPEKFNSVIWISKTKDTLAMGNITGAMVFQSCIPVAIGILFTNWQLDIKVLVSAGFALSSTLVTYLWMKVKGKLTPFPLLMGGVFYASFIVFLVMKGFK